MAQATRSAAACCLPTDDITGGSFPVHCGPAAPGRPSVGPCRLLRRRPLPIAHTRLHWESTSGAVLPMGNYFEDALNGRIDEMLDACTRCGKCVEACPVKTPAGVVAPAEEVITGVIDILRGDEGAAASRRWASTCMLTG